MENHQSRKLLLSGMILFLLGLLNGLVISLFENPRMGLSAHLAGVQNGLVLLAFGLFWQKVKLGDSAKRWCLNLNIYSMYAIWFALVLAAMWGTSSATPIAGASFSSTLTKEYIVNFFLYSGSGAIIIASIQVILGLIQWKPIRA